MIIRADKEGTQLIEGLLDLALKSGGMQNLNAVNLARAGLRPLPEEPAEPPVELREDPAELPTADQVRHTLLRRQAMDTNMS
jgi:hypothetical protein